MHDTKINTAPHLCCGNGALFSQVAASTFTGNAARPDDLGEVTRAVDNGYLDSYRRYPGGGVVYVAGRVYGDITMADCNFEGNQAYTMVSGGTSHGGVLNIMSLARRLTVRCSAQCKLI